MNGFASRQAAAVFVCLIAVMFGVGAFLGTMWGQDAGLIEWCKSIANGLIYAGLTALKLSDSARASDKVNGAPKN